MVKSSLRVTQSEAETGKHVVDQARRWIREMAQAEARGPGDYLNALARLSTRHRLSYSALWGLLYRPPKDLRVGFYTKLRQARESERSRRLANIRRPSSSIFSRIETPAPQG